MTYKCPSILGKSAENSIDNDMSFWQKGSCSELYEFATHPGQFDRELRSVGIGTGELIENRKKLGDEIRLKGKK